MPHADVNFSFPEERRLKSSLRIREIVSGRAAVSKHPVKCFYKIGGRGTDTEMRVAMLVSKRKFRRAVDRNRVKRLLREAFRLNCNTLSVPDNLRIDMCWMFTGYDLPDHSSVMLSGKSIFDTLQTILNNHGTDKENC